MKKKTKWLLCLLLAAFLGITAGGIKLYNDLLPKAKPIKIPKTETIVSAYLSCNTTDATVSMSETHLETLFEAIGEAKPTRIQAWNDTPTVRPYYGIEIQTSDRLYSYFVYEDNKQIYIEMPYEGIYEANASLSDLVMQYFQEGGTD